MAPPTSTSTSRASASRQVAGATWLKISAIVTVNSACAQAAPSSGPAAKAAVITNGRPISATIGYGPTTTSSAALTTAPARVPRTAGPNAVLVSAAEVRIRVSVASPTQNPWVRSSAVASNRAPASATAVRTAFSKVTDRGVRCSRSRAHHSAAVEREAYGRTADPAGSRPDPAGRSPAATVAASRTTPTASATSAAVPATRTRSTSIASSAAASVSDCRRSRSKRRWASARPPGRGARPVASPSDTSRSVPAAAESRAALAGYGCPARSVSWTRSTRLCATRSAPAASTSARSAAAGDQGRSPSGWLSGRAARVACAAPSRAVASRAAGTASPPAARATASTCSAVAAAASASRCRYGGGAGSGHSSRSARASRTTPTTRPVSLESSVSGAYGGKHGRM